MLFIRRSQDEAGSLFVLLNACTASDDTEGARGEQGHSGLEETKDGVMSHLVYTKWHHCASGEL